MDKKKYKKYKASREFNPAFDLNQIGKIAFNRAKAGERYQRLEIITAQLMCALTMEAILNILGKRLFQDWEEIERGLSHKKKLQKIAKHLKIDLGSGSFQLLPEIFGLRDHLVHAKPSLHFTNVFHQSATDENGFPIIESVPELLTDWEKFCNIGTAERWRKAVERMSSILSEAARCPDPIKIDGAIDTWGEIET